MSFRTSDFDYTLPPELIAHRPLARRDDARMMVLHRESERIEHRHFRDFAALLGPNVLAVLNDTRVLPARAFTDDERVEFLFLEPFPDNSWK